MQIGVDLVEVGNFKRVFEERGSLQESVFTQEELCRSRHHRNTYVSLAVRFAIKEAVFKALGDGLSGEMDWRDVELQEDASGKPALKLHGRTARVAQETGIKGGLFSFSYTRNYALALVLFHCGRSPRAENENDFVRIGNSDLGT